MAVVEALLDAGASLEGREGATCLHIAASKWKGASPPELRGLAYRLCLAAGPTLRDATAHAGRTALHAAAEARSWFGLVLVLTDASCRQVPP